MLHKVAPCPKGSMVPGHYVSPGRFRAQMRLFKALGFETCDLDDLFDKPLPRRPLAITFDDGYENYLVNAVPVLSELDYRATVFLVAHQIGGSNEWDTRRGDAPERLMSLEQIRTAAKQGTRFGSHTLDHADLTQVSENEVRQQICGSKALLEELLGYEVGTFCYPYGRKSASVVQVVREAGYRLACSTMGGTNTPDTDRYQLRRTNIRSDTNLPVLLFKLLRDFRRG